MTQCRNFITATFAMSGFFASKKPTLRPVPALLRRPSADAASAGECHPAAADATRAPASSTLKSLAAGPAWLREDGGGVAIAWPAGPAWAGPDAESRAGNRRAGLLRRRRRGVGVDHAQTGCCEYTYHHVCVAFAQRGRGASPRASARW